MAWIDVTERLPELGRRVYVRGKYVREGTGFPIAYLRDTAREHHPYIKSYYNGGRIRWESSEWRGSVAITHWWEGEPDEEQDHHA